MENKTSSFLKEKQKISIPKEQKEKLNKSSFSNFKSNNIISQKNFINIIIILFLFFIFYFLFIKDVDSDELNTLEIKAFEEKNYFFTDIQPSKLIINNNTNNFNETVIVGIKFGSINSGYSYSFGKNLSAIISEKKKSTELELSKETKKGLKFSFKSSVSLMNYRDDELDKIIFLKGFKTLLYENVREEEVFYKYNSDYTDDNLNIFTQYFNLLKNEILFELRKKNKYNFIKWVLAIPENINQFEKQLIKNFTTELEMFNLDLIYESEATSLAMYYDKSIPESVKQKNKVFMLIDAGGYSIDITIYKIIDDNGSIKQLLETKQFNLGVLDISNKIIKILKEMFGEKILNKNKNDYPGEWIKILNEINKIIEDTNNINGIEIYEMKNYFEKKYERFIYKNKTIKSDKNTIYFPLSLSGKLIDENMESIKYISQC